jgi:hypothetical protein
MWRLNPVDQQALAGPVNARAGDRIQTDDGFTRWGWNKIDPARKIGSPGSLPDAREIPTRPGSRVTGKQKRVDTLRLGFICRS